MLELLFRPRLSRLTHGKRIVYHNFCCRGMDRHVLALVLCTVIGASEGWTAETNRAQPLPPVELTLATGNEQGLYYRIGQEIATNLATHGIAVRVIPSSGSVNNLNLLASNQVQICIAQADILGHLYTSGEVQALLPLYTEVVHVLIRNPVRVRRIKDLQSRRISVGPAGGGTERNAMSILEAADIVRSDSPIVRESFDATAQGLRNGGLDAAFLTIGYPTSLLEDLMKSRCVSLFEPDNDILEQLLNTMPGLVLSSIPAGTYSHQEDGVDTLGIPAMLVVRADMDAALAERITQLVAADLRDILKHSGIQPSRQSISSQMDRIRIPVHPGANQYYEKQQTRLRAVLVHWSSFVGIPILLCLVLFWSYKKAARIARFYARHPAARAVSMLLCVWFMGSVVMYYAEHRANDNYATLSMSLWSTLVNWINFGAKEPISTLGRANSTIMTLMGMGGISWLVGEVAAVLIRQRNKEANMCKTMKDHFVIINWNTTGLTLVDRIRSMQKEMDLHGDIVLVSAPPSAAGLNTIVVPCDPLSKEIIQITNMQNARSVIVLSPEGASPDVADARNILIVMNLAQRLPKGKAEQPHIAVEVQDPGKVHLLDAVEIPLDVVSTKTVTTDLIVQVAGNPGLTQIYTDLLTNGKDSNEIYSITLAERWKGKSFADLCTACATLRQNALSILPLAISRGGAVHVNPTSEVIPAIEDGDVLFAVCDSLSNLRQLNRI